MEEPKDEENPKPSDGKVWTTENDSNGNETNLSSESNYTVG